ncbi:hypothetical protein Droror1_Dr00017107 [Drosera rotundifolia]
MSTTVRGGANSREKMGASPSDPHQKKPLKSSSSSSSSDQKTSATSSEKPVPNYLKPTLSSRMDSSDPGKRPSNEISAHKSPLDRRRSFDKPPSSLQLQKALQGAASINLRAKPVRSTSFSSATKNASSSSKSSLAKAISMKKSPTAVSGKKDIVGSSLKKKAPKSVTSESSVEAHDKELNLDHMVIDDAAAATDNEDQSLPEISEMLGDELELGDPPIEAEPNHAKPDMEKADKQEEEAQDEDQGEMASHPAEKDADIKEQAPRAIANTEEEEINKHQGDAAEELAEHEVKAKVNDDEEKEDIAEAVENGDKPEVEEEQAGDEKKAEESVEEAKDGDSSEGEVKEAKTETETASSSVRQQPVGPGGKKEAQVYNDVIEETASKLMENRKNKVRALAGAFETVISLQEK